VGVNAPPPPEGGGKKGGGKGGGGGSTPTWRRGVGDHDEDLGDAFAARLARLERGAEVHRKTRQVVQSQLRPGMRLVDIAESVESTARKLIGYDPRQPLAAGMAFPCGVSVNHCAAHYTPNPGERGGGGAMGALDICKIDFGVHVEGDLVDCAFSCAFDPMHDGIMRAVQESTEAAIAASGVDVRVRDIGAAW
jgi:methionyl aminopeptidase